jgi:nucleolar protein 14
MAAESPSKVPFMSLYGTVNEAHLYFQVINTALDLIGVSSTLWKNNIALPEIFLPTVDILRTITETDLPETLSTHINDIRSSLAQRIKLSLGSRGPLALQDHRPIPIPSYLPKYTMSYSLDSKNDPDHERSGLGKLRAQHRREKKSIIRELRKEARTEAVVKSDEGKRRDKAYQEKMKIATGIMKGGNSGIGKWERDQKRKRK